MSTYTYSTSGDASLFFEVPDPDTDAAPRRAAAGTLLPAYDPSTGSRLPDLEVRAAGYVDQRYEVPRIAVDADGVRAIIESVEWRRARGEGSGGAYWIEGVNLPDDPLLLLPGDLLHLTNGTSARWDGAQWITVAVSGGGTGGVVVTPAPITPTPTEPDPGAETPTPTTNTLPFVTSFDTSAGWAPNAYRPGVTISGGVATISGDGSGHYEIAPVTPGQWVEATATVTAGGSGTATLFVASYNGDPGGSGQFLDVRETALAGGTVTVQAQVASGADRILIGLKGGGNALIKVEALAAKTIAAPTVTVPGATTPPASGGAVTGSRLTGLIPLAGKNAFTVRVDQPSTPLNPNSAAYVKRFIESCMSTACKGINLNAYQYNCVYYTAGRNTRRVNVRCLQTNDAWKMGVWGSWANDVPIDPAWKPAVGTDGHIAVYLPEAEGGGPGGTLWEFHAFTNGNPPSAYHGGRIQRVAYSMGRYEYPWGVSASGLAFPGFAITLREMRAGYIDHAVYIANQMTKPGNQWPANRDDGWSSAHAWDMIEGMRVRLDPGVNVDALPMSRAGKIIARAIQQYGMIVADKTSYDNSLCTESGMSEKVTKGTSVDPWDAVLGGQATWDVMDGFPLERLQVVADGYGRTEVEAYLSGVENTGAVAPVTGAPAPTEPAPVPEPDPAPEPDPVVAAPATGAVLADDAFTATTTATEWPGCTIINKTLDVPVGSYTRSSVPVSGGKTVTLTVTAAASSLADCYYRLDAHDEWGGWLGSIDQGGSSPGESTSITGPTPAGTAQVRPTLINNGGTVRIAAVKITS